MAIKLEGLLFTGPFDLDTTVVRHNQAAVVYAVVDKRGESWDPKYDVIAVGDTAGETVAFGELPDLAAWRSAGQGKVGLYFHSPAAPPRSDEAAALRRQIVADLRRLIPAKAAG